MSAAWWPCDGAAALSDGGHPRVGLRPQRFGGWFFVGRALWGFGGVWVCGWLLGLGVSWALWMVAVVVGLLLGVGCEFVLWVSVVGVVCWCGLVWFQVGFGVWGGQGSARAKLYLINKYWYPPP